MRCEGRTIVTLSSPSGAIMGTAQASEVILCILCLSLGCRRMRRAPSSSTRSRNRQDQDQGRVELPPRRRSRRDRSLSNDPTLLVAALEDIESKRLAIESLVDAGLLWQCLT